MMKSLFMLATGFAVAVSVWGLARMDRLLAAEIVWALLMASLVGLSVYRIRIGSFPRHFLRSGALSRLVAPNAAQIDHVDLLGASLTFVATLYSVLLGLLILDSVVNETIRKLLRLISL